VKTPRDVAAWMAREVQRSRYLDQSEVAIRIGRRFGTTFVYDNIAARPVPVRAVLREFRKLTRNNVVWDCRQRRWRLRGPDDDPGRLQD